MSELALPALKNDGAGFLYPYFPTPWQCFVFRMAGRVGAARIAAVLGTDADKVRAAAAEMGVPADTSAAAEAVWLERGYISLIRDSWRLLTYRQLETLLGWDEARLAYALKEDDFLSVKLGNYKPDVPELRMTPLDASDRADTERLRAAVSDFYRLAGLGEVPAKPPFGFEYPAVLPRTVIADASGNVRLAYAYPAIYGDTFTSDFDYSFPDALLEAYRADGVTGVWCQAVLYKLAPYPFMPELSEGYQARLAGMKALTERLARHGLKLFLYLNEPRALPTSYFADHPGLRGHTQGDFTSLCTSAAPVQRYLYETAAFLTENVPLLGGFFTITASENLTSCYSHARRTDCPRCMHRSPGEIYAEINDLLYRGAKSHSPDFTQIVWTWGWPADQVKTAVEKLDAEIIVQSVSEHGCKKVIGGTETSVDDYSISVVGPGEDARSVWAEAGKAGHRCCAKVQLNNSWECSAVPYLPVFDTVWEHLSRLRAAGVTSLMLDWTVGGYPSPSFYLAARAFSGPSVPDREAVFTELFTKNQREAVCRFSEAFDEYPFHIGNAYCGPQNIGPANPLFASPTGLKATMVGYPYDDLGSWRAVFPEDVFEDQLRRLSEKWKTGLDLLTPSDGELWSCAEAAYCHFRSSYLQTRFVRLRDADVSDADGLAAVCGEEAGLALRLARAADADAAIGFEPTNHYYYCRALLAEKYLNCRWLLRKLGR